MMFQEFQCQGFSGYRIENPLLKRMEDFLPGPQGEPPKKGKLFLERHGRKHFRITGNPGIHLKVYPPDQPKVQAVWERALALRAKGVPTPEPFFYGLHEESGWSVFGSQWIFQAKSWIQHLHDLTGVSRGNFLCNLGRFVAALHSDGVYQKDLSHWNILMDGKKRFWLVDLEDLYLSKSLSARKRFRNLTQIFCSALDECSLEERKIFFFEYNSLDSPWVLLFCFPLVEWFAKRRKKRIQKKYRRKYGREYSALE